MLSDLPCKSYIITDKESGYELEIDNEYIMSPKDSALLDFSDRDLNDRGWRKRFENRRKSPLSRIMSKKCHHVMMKP